MKDSEKKEKGRMEVNFQKGSVDCRIGNRAPSPCLEIMCPTGNQPKTSSLEFLPKCKEKGPKQTTENAR